MNNQKFKNAFVVILFVCTITFYSSTSLQALDLFSKNEIEVIKSDSTKSKSVNSQTINSDEKKKKAQHVKPTSNLTYNIIYYLISKFIKTNPINRPK